MCAFALSQTGCRPFSLAAQHGSVEMLELLMEEPYYMATTEGEQVSACETAMPQSGSVSKGWAL